MTFVSRDLTLRKNLYFSLGRPHLEYAVQVWSPKKEMDFGLIKQVQARSTKIQYSMRNLSYEARLTKWGIKRLEDRRVRGDLIVMYKSLNGLDEINWDRNTMINTPTDIVLKGSNVAMMRVDTL